jgi:hypothetical protein
MFVRSGARINRSDLCSEGVDDDAIAQNPGRPAQYAHPPASGIRQSFSVL